MRTVGCIAVILLSSIARCQDVTAYVDPFIGTAGGGNTFPGAVRPWGMVSVSPQNAPGSPSGYLHGMPQFYGFGHVHLSGTGCADLGSVIVTVVKDLKALDSSGARTAYSTERAHPGFYALTLDSLGLDAEATTTLRSGIVRFTARTAGEWTVLLDAGRSLGSVRGGALRLVSPSSAEGFNDGGGFCGEMNRHRVFFSTVVDRTPIASGTWRGAVASSADTVECGESGGGTWFRVHLEAGGSLEVRTGISYVSVANARMNREKESDGLSFDRIRSEAEKEWAGQLLRVAVEGGTDADRSIFYSSLYHVLIHPSIISDANGEYPLMGHTGIGKRTDRPRYSVFSLWDTYRTTHPLLSLVYPERQSDMVATMLDMYKESGWLPKWELASNETHLMVGDPASIVIADSYIDGVSGFDARLAFDAIRKSANATTAVWSPPVRAGYHEMLRYGFIPVDQDTSREWWTWGPVSTTLEYCLADFAVAQMALAIGDTSEWKKFSRTSLFYRNLYDTATTLLRPRRSDGRWLEPFDPDALEGSGNWSGSGGPGYVEGNAWTYQWFVPHDIAGLAHLMGGTDAAARALVSWFDKGKYDPTNEPDIATPYLFTLLPGFEQRTAPLVRNFMRKSFRCGPAGLPGNDDAGALSAWYVFSALGLYPACPASGAYQLGAPMFNRVKISAGTAETPSLIIERSGSFSDRASVDGVTFNGIKLHGFSIGVRTVRSGGTLKFQMKE